MCTEMVDLHLPGFSSTTHPKSGPVAPLKGCAQPLQHGQAYARTPRDQPQQRPTNVKLSAMPTAMQKTGHDHVIPSGKHTKSY
jgi:hypothetical protein